MTTPTKNSNNLEKILSKRLRILAFVLISFGAISLSYAFFSSTTADADDVEEEETIKQPNYYVVTTIFVLLGTGLVYYVWKRNKD